MMDEFTCSECCCVLPMWAGIYPENTCVDCFSKSCAEKNFTSLKTFDEPLNLKRRLNGV